MFDNFKFFSRYTKKLFLAAGNRQTDKRPKIKREISAKLARKTLFAKHKTILYQYDEVL
jgi:hypothetical protein